MYLNTSVSSYEAAWIAALPTEALASLSYKIYGIAVHGHLLRKKILDRLVCEQQLEGWWGSPFSAGDRLLHTAAVTFALTTAVDSEPLYAYHLQKAHQYLAKVEAYHPENDLADLAGIELILPALSARLASAGITLKLSDYLLEKAKHKQKVPMPLVLTPGSTFSHALEFVEALHLEPKLVNGAFSKNGSMGNSPSATAFALGYAWNVLDDVVRENALDYLASAAILDVDGVPSWSVTYPANEFLEIWHRYYYYKLNGKVLSGASPARHGAGADQNFAVDADTTATCLILANLSGDAKHIVPMLETLLQFYSPEKQWFTTYPFELTASITTNAHAWEALHQTLQRSKLPPVLEQSARQALQGAAKFIRSQVKDCTWQDKWHVSQIYATAQVVLCGVLSPIERSATLAWISENQQADGGWGLVTSDSNPDDTIHALLTLLYSQPYHSSAEKFRLEGAIKRGKLWLAKAMAEYPPNEWMALWCDKTLYCPWGLLYLTGQHVLAAENVVVLPQRAFN